MPSIIERVRMDSSGDPRSYDTRAATILLRAMAKAYEENGADLLDDGEMSDVVKSRIDLTSRNLAALGSRRAPGAKGWSAYLNRVLKESEVK